MTITPTPFPTLQASSNYSPIKPGATQTAGLQTAAFIVLQLYVFLLISRATEYALDPNGTFHIILILGVLAGGLTIVTGGFARALSTSSGLWLTAFTAWCIFEVPFSSWRGGSLHGLVDGWLKSYLTYIFIAGLIFSMKQLRSSMTMIVIGTICVLLIAYKLGEYAEADGRFYVGGKGTLNNSNDLATQLLLAIPFFVQIVCDKGRSWFIRIPVLAAIPLVLSVMLKTGSRAALIATGMLVVFLFFRTSAKNKLLILVAGSLVILTLPFAVPEKVKERYTSILTGNTVTLDTSDIVKSAVESELHRERLLVHALRLTARNPLFGVGIGQFAPSSADLSLSDGEPPMWRTVHNFVFLVMVETGIPGLILYIGALVACFRTLFRILKEERKRGVETLGGKLANALLFSLVGFTACLLFSPGAFLFHFPLMCALVTALQVNYWREVSPKSGPPVQRLSADFGKKLSTIVQPQAY